MARFIDADKIITDAVKEKKFFIEYDDVFNSQKVVKTIYGDFADFINSQPTADVVEVVRCKDCEFFREYSDAHKRAVERADGDCFLKQTHSYDEHFMACRYNDFCSDGKRKEGAE